MISIDVEVTDFDSGKTICLTLPTNLSGTLDSSHNLQIDQYDFEILLPSEDVFELNEILKLYNTWCPELTKELLELICDSTGEYDITDQSFMDKIFYGDYMLEEIETEDKGIIDEESVAAKYLATELHIPFANNLPTNDLDKIVSDLCFDWGNIWPYYSLMGFQIVWLDDSMYILNWEDAPVLNK